MGLLDPGYVFCIVVVSEYAKLHAAHVLVPYVPRVLSALMPHVHHAVHVLLPYMPHAPCALVPRALHGLMLYVPCALKV